MKLDDLDEVQSLRTQRARVAALLSAAPAGSLNLTVWHEGGHFDIASIVPIDVLRQAIIQSCHRELSGIDQNLRKLGVSMPVPSVPADTMDGLQRDIDMYVRAWVRELGGKLLNKRHLIDALVLTTKDLRERAERAEETLRQNQDQSVAAA